VIPDFIYNIERGLSNEKNVWNETAIVCPICKLEFVSAQLESAESGVIKIKCYCENDFRHSWIIKIVSGKGHSEIFIEPLYIIHREYINSKKWKAIKSIKLEEQDVCENCGIDTDLHVHHKHYNTLGFESMDDLMVLCANCHKKLHEVKDV
jgi:5-methylcytosine-specific restriction endonuclease McrA